MRQSYQVNARNPVVWSNAIFGLNWLLVVVSLLSLMAGLHVVPESSECFSKMSMLLLSFGVSDVHIRYSRWLLERSHATPTSASTERPLWAGMKSNPPTLVFARSFGVPKTAGPTPSGSSTP